MNFFAVMQEVATALYLNYTIYSVSQIYLDLKNIFNFLVFG